jgi:tetratricopeptide (TPR) repeat protein
LLLCEVDTPAPYRLSQPTAPDTLPRSDTPLEDPPVPLIERLRFVQRQTTLLIALCVIAVAAYFLTRSLAGATHALHRSDAARWQALGQQRLAEGDMPGAITALRRAAASDHYDRNVQVALAAAHRQAGQTDAARDVLVAALRRFPDDPDVHLHLATLEAAGGATDEAIRHYQSALLSLWGPDQLERRRRLREEFIEFLLNRGLEPRALSESLLLAGEIQHDAASHLKVGALLHRAGDHARGLQQFEAALQLAPRDEEALARAGEAAFEIGEYAQALRHLSRVPGSTRSQALLPSVELVLALDPLRPGLAVRERHRRLAAAAELLRDDIGRCRAAVCPGGAACAATEAFATEIAATRTALRRAAREPDTVEPGLATLADFARRQAAICAPGREPPLLHALRLITSRYGVAP